MSKGSRVAMLVAAVVAIMAISAGSGIAAPPGGGGGTNAKWTVMVYMSGDNNLEDYIVKDIELELAAMGSTPNVQVTALADRGPGFDKSRGDWQTTKLYHPTQGMLADAPARSRTGASATWGAPRR